MYDYLQVGAKLEASDLDKPWQVGSGARPDIHQGRARQRLHAAYFATTTLGPQHYGKFS
jgi:hypothetical protein